MRDELGKIISSELSSNGNHITTMPWKPYWYTEPFGIPSDVGLSVYGLSHFIYLSYTEKKNVNTNLYFHFLLSFFLFIPRGTTEDKISYKSSYQKNSCSMVACRRPFETVLKGQVIFYVSWNDLYFTFLTMTLIIVKRMQLAVWKT